jgi:hypothetical protein
LVQLGKALATQDNLATASPIFMVQQRRRVYGFDTAYDDGSHTVWLSDESNELSRADLREMYFAALDHEDPGNRDRQLEGWPAPGTATDGDIDRFFEEHSGDFALTRTAYQDFWDNMQPFFTRAGAEEYIRANSHNLRHPRVYVESAYRNPEWQAIRVFLEDLAKHAP